MDVSFWFTCRRYDRRTRRWRFWWIRWGTCCGMSTPCWRSGNNGPTSSTFCKETPPQKLELHNGKDQVKKGISVGFWIWDRPLVAHLFLCWHSITETHYSLTDFRRTSAVYSVLYCRWANYYCHGMNNNNLIHSSCKAADDPVCVCQMVYNFVTLCLCNKK